MCSSTSSQSVMTSGRLMARACRARRRAAPAATPSASAAATRSGSCAQRKSSTAPSIAGSPSRGAQLVGRQAGQREQPLGAVVVATAPSPARASASAGGIFDRMFRAVKNCQLSVSEIMVVKSSVGGGSNGGAMAKRILVVEDNDLNRKLFCDVLQSQGFAVEPVADGREALERARQFVPNLVIMDIQLPNVSGLDLIDAAQGRTPTLRRRPGARGHRLCRQGRRGADPRGRRRGLPRQAGVDRTVHGRGQGPGRSRRRPAANSTANAASVTTRPATNSR